MWWQPILWVFIGAMFILICEIRRSLNEFCDVQSIVSSPHGRCMASVGLELDILQGFLFMPATVALHQQCSWDWVNSHKAVIGFAGQGSPRCSLLLKVCFYFCIGPFADVVAIYKLVVVVVSFNAWTARKCLSTKPGLSEESLSQVQLAALKQPVMQLNSLL